MNEREAARRFTDGLDRLLSGTAEGDVAHETGLDLGLWETAGRLAALPDLLPAPDAAFERRVWTRLRAAEDRSARSGRVPGWRPRLVWRALALAAVLFLLVFVALPGPRQVMSNWMARFGLGGVEVVVAPEELARPALDQSIRHFDAIDDAQAVTGFTLAAPAYLPAGYRLDRVLLVSLPGLSSAEEPLYVDLSYRPGDSDPLVDTYLVLRQYDPAARSGMALTEIEFQADVVRTAVDVNLPNGLPGVLVEFDAAQPDGQVILRQLIWDQAGRATELWSTVLSTDDMLRVAASVQ